MTNEFTFTVNNATFTQGTKVGYYYKAENGKKTRISESVYAEAMEQWIKETTEQAEVEEAKAEVKPAKKNTKKAKKNAAFTLKTEDGEYTLTEKQVIFIRNMKRDDFYENGLDSILFVDCYCDCLNSCGIMNPMTAGAMVSTLSEKGVIACTRDNARVGKPTLMAFTGLGRAMAKELGLE